MGSSTMKAKKPQQAFTRTLHRTARGFAGRYGGRWAKMPSPPQWYAMSNQVNGIYPFAAGSARPTDGAPLGRDLLTGTAVCTDHEALYQAGVISSPSMMLVGINGVGKSTTAQTILLGQVGRGLTPMIFNPLKSGEHSALIRALGGVVFEFGTGERHAKINLLSKGPLGQAARSIRADLDAAAEARSQSGQAREPEWVAASAKVVLELEEASFLKCVELVQLIARISRGREPIEDIEETALEAAVKTAWERFDAPVSRDLLTVIEDPSEHMLRVTGQEEVAAFRSRFRRLRETVTAMLSGQMGALISGKDMVEIDTGNPGGVCFDTSSIGAANEKLQSAAMLSCWSLGMDAIDAHWELAEHESRLAEWAATQGQEYEPRVHWGGYTSFMEEFWYPIRAMPGLIDRVDALSRSNRSKGTAELKAFHTPKDFLSLANPDDVEKAKSLIKHTGLLGLMALTAEDLSVISATKELTEEEISMVAGFNAAEDWIGHRRAKGGKTAPPGAGKILLKVENRMGIPVKMLQTKAQESLHVTDVRYRKI